jgi:hypothetical protein
MEMYQLHAAVALPEGEELSIGDWVSPRASANRFKRGVPAIIDKFYFITAHVYSYKSCIVNVMFR